MTMKEEVKFDRAEILEKKVKELEELLSEKDDRLSSAELLVQELMRVKKERIEKWSHNLQYYIERYGTITFNEVEN